MKMEITPHIQPTTILKQVNGQFLQDFITVYDNANSIREKLKDTDFMFIKDNHTLLRLIAAEMDILTIGVTSFPADLVKKIQISKEATEQCHTYLHDFLDKKMIL